MNIFSVRPFPEVVALLTLSFPSSSFPKDKLSPSLGIANNYVFLAYWEVPITAPRAFTHDAQFAILKLF